MKPPTRYCNYWDDVSLTPGALIIDSNWSNGGYWRLWWSWLPRLSAEKKALTPWWVMFLEHVLVMLSKTMSLFLYEVHENVNSQTVKKHNTILLSGFRGTGLFYANIIHFTFFSQASLGVTSTLASSSEVNGEQVDENYSYEMIKVGCFN